MKFSYFPLILCALLLTGDLFPQPGDTSTIVYAPPRDSRPDTSKPNLPPDLNPVTTPIVTHNLFTVVLWSGKTEQEARNVARGFDSKGYDLKIFRGSGFKKSDYMVTTGFFKKRLDAEYLKRGLIKHLKNRKLWVKQVDSRMSELVYVPSGHKQNPIGEVAKDKPGSQALSNTSLTSLLNMGRLVMMYGTLDDVKGLLSLTEASAPFIHTVFNGGAVASVSGEKSFPVNFALYKRFFLAFNPRGRFDPWSSPVLVTMPDRARLMKVKNFIEADGSIDQSTKKNTFNALNKVTRQLVLKDARIWLATTGSGWYIAGVEEIK